VTATAGAPRLGEAIAVVVDLTTELMPVPLRPTAPACKRLHRITIRERPTGNTLDSDSEPREVHR